MKKKMKRFIVLIVIIPAAYLFTGYISLNGDEEGDKSADTRNFGFEYFPLSVGKTLVYDSNFGETRSEVKSIDNELTIINESDDFKYIQRFIVKDDGIYITQTEHHLDVFLFISSEAEIKYNEPALRIPIPFNEKSQWEWTGTEYKDNDTSAISIKGKYLERVELDTKAGKFDCVKIELKVESETGSKSIVNEWLAPGIGLVKLHAKIDGKGLIGVLQSILGFDEINFELKEII